MPMRAYRTMQGGEGGVPLDTSAVLWDGTKVNGPIELRQALLHYSPQFVRSITEKLMTFGIGRGVEYQDMPVIRSIVRDADKDNDRFVSLLMGIIRSAPFQMRTKEVREQEIRSSQMFISRKFIPRRTFLRGAGVTIGLPLLDSMVPAQTPHGQDRGSSGAALPRHLASARRGAGLLEPAAGRREFRILVHHQASRTVPQPRHADLRDGYAGGHGDHRGARRRSCARRGASVRRAAAAKCGEPLSRHHARSVDRARNTGRTPSFRRFSSAWKKTATSATATGVTAAPTRIASPGLRPCSRCRRK